MAKWVYAFGGSTSDGESGMKNLLGGKGANLAEMSNIGLPVPPGFTITTEVCTYYYAHGETYPVELKDAVEKALAEVGRIAGGKLGDTANPLLVSVRSGARVSMPGMMDTVLNLGLNAETTEGLAKLTGNPRFAYDSYRPSSRCIPTLYWAWSTRCSRKSSTARRKTRATNTIPI
jgi:pyruvate,orthophosphate dikinase